MRGYPQFYDPAAVKSAKATLFAHMLPYRPKEPLHGPLYLYVEWRFQAKSHKPGEWRSTKPDTDNLQKGLKDVLTYAGFWEDDAQVVWEVSRKLWSNDPGITIRIMEVNNNGILTD